jgi:hypothetical protein
MKLVIKLVLEVMMKKSKSNLKLKKALDILE